MRFFLRGRGESARMHACRLCLHRTRDCRDNPPKKKIFVGSPAGLLFVLALGEGLQVLQGQNGTYGSLHSRCMCSVLLLPYICPHTTMYIRPFRILVRACPQGAGLQGLQGQNGKYASLNIRYMCPHTTIYLSSCYCMYVCAQGEGLHGQNGKYASLHIRVAYGSSKYQGRDEAEGERAQSFIT
jgi:hypothetical protein